MSLFECINCLLFGKVVLLFVTLLEKSASLSGLCPAVRSKMGELDGQSLQTGILCGSMDCRDDAHWRWHGHLHAGVFEHHECVVVVNEDSWWSWGGPSRILRIDGFVYEDGRLWAPQDSFGWWQEILFEGHEIESLLQWLCHENQENALDFCWRGDTMLPQIQFQ